MMNKDKQQQQYRSTRYQENSPTRISNSLSSWNCGNPSKIKKNSMNYSIAPKTILEKSPSFIRRTQKIFRFDHQLEACSSLGNGNLVGFSSIKEQASKALKFCNGAEREFINQQINKNFHGKSLKEDAASITLRTLRLLNINSEKNAEEQANKQRVKAIFYEALKICMGSWNEGGCLLDIRDASNTEVAMAAIAMDAEIRKHVGKRSLTNKKRLPVFEQICNSRNTE